jgi:RNA polymerase sigma factor (sigma-70 family)
VLISRKITRPCRARASVAPRCRIAAVAAAREDWAAIVDRLLAGDEVACLKLSRLVTGFLAGWRAYDFRDDWEDLVQEVLIAVIVGAREGRTRDRRAVVGYVRAIAHNKYADRLKKHLRQREDQTLEWEEASERWEAKLPSRPARDELVVGMRRSLEKLPEAKARVVYAVYGEDKTYEQVALETRIPLGTVKRYLRDGLKALRREYRTQQGSG